MPSLSSFPVSYDGVQVVLHGPATDTMCVKHWSKGRFYEARPAELLDYMARNYEGPLDRWIDIGAHFGNHATFASEVLGFEDVLAFEPSAKNREVLDVQCPNVFVYNVGCSDKYRRVNLADIDAPDHSGSKYIAKEGEPCILTDLDALNLPGANVIKIDTEGHEKHVIRGAMQTITKYRPWLLVETDDPEGVLAMLPSYEPPIKTANASPTYVYKPQVQLATQHHHAG